MLSMNREKSLFKNTIIITIGKICTQLITFLLLPLYTGILTTAEYGTVDLLNTLVSLCLPIITLQIEQAVFRELLEVRNKEQEIKDIISSAIFTVIVQSIIFLILFVIVAPAFKNVYKYFLATNVIAYIFSSLFLQITRGLGNSKKYAFASFISALGTILFNILFIVGIKLGAKGMLLGTMLGQMITVIYLFISLRLYKYISIKNNKKKITKKLLKYSIPLIPNAISWWVFNASDRLIVTAILGVEKNGILAASLKFSTVYITLYNVFNISWTESISTAIDDEDLSVYFNKTFNVIIKLFIAMAIGIIAVMPIVYPIMINKKFDSGYVLVPVSILGSFFNVVVGLISVIYIGKKNTKAIANTSVISAIINIIVHLSLIKFLGLYAAVISTLTSFIIMSVYRIVDINKKYFKIIIDNKVVLETLIITSLILILYYVNNKYLNIVSIFIAIIYGYFLNKNSINVIANMLKRKMKKSEG